MYALDMPGQFAFVARRHCGELGLDPGDLRALSVRNLRMRRSKPQVRQGGTFLMLTLDAELEASLLLADIVWEQLAPGIPGDLIAAVPARHILVVSGTGVTSGAGVLRRGVVLHAP